MRYLDEYDLAVLKADTNYAGAVAAYEMAELTYNQLCRNAEYKVMSEGGDADDLAFYYQEADDKSGDKANIIVRIIQALKKFLQAVWKKIKEIFTKIKEKIMKFIHRNSINIGGRSKLIVDGRKHVLDGLSYIENNFKPEEMEKTQATAIPSADDAVKAIYLRGRQGAAVAIKRPGDLQKIVAKFDKIAKGDGFINSKKADKIIESLNKDIVEPLTRKAEGWESKAKNAGENDINTRGFKLLADIARSAATYAAETATAIDMISAKAAKADSGAAKANDNEKHESAEDFFNSLDLYDEYDDNVQESYESDNDDFELDDLYDDEYDDNVQESYESDNDDFELDDFSNFLDTL
jgi:hypothetical protein